VLSGCQERAFFLINHGAAILPISGEESSIEPKRLSLLYPYACQRIIIQRYYDAQTVANS